MKKRTWIAVGLAGCALLALIGTLAFPKDKGEMIRTVQVIRTITHDTQAFSQGLAIANGELYEGTGHYGQSTLRRLDLSTGKILANVPLAPQYFGEGITIMDGKIYQLTWKERVCIVYDLATLQPINTLSYGPELNEGWGLANDGKNLYLSDGTAGIRILDPQTFKQVRRIRVKSGPRPIEKLNELEFVDGELWANIWYSDRIARISPENGEVLGWIDAAHLYPLSKRPTREHVLNGIAYDPITKRLFLTGKNWPSIFEIKVNN